MLLNIIVGLLLIGPAGSGPSPLADSVRAALSNHARLSGEDVEVTAIRVPPQSPALGGVAFRVEPVRPGRLGGHVVVMVSVAAKPSEIRRVPVSCTVKTFARAYVAQHRLERHAILTPDDVSLTRVETTYLPEDFLRAGPLPQGVRTERIVQEGTVICAGMLEPEPLIHAGDTVTLVTRANGVRVTVAAIAREDGRAGATIAVQPLGSGQRFHGKVRDARTVERFAE